MTIRNSSVKRWAIRLCRFRSLVGVLIVALFPASAWTQEAELPPWLEIGIIEVKSDRIADFEDLAKEIVAARDEAGMPPVQVAQVVAGNTNVYHVVIGIEALVANDNPSPPMEPAEMAAWENRIAQTVVSSRWFYARTYPQHQIITDGAAEATLLFLRTVRVAGGRADDYEDWIENDLMPALRETNVLGHTMSRGVFGDSNQHFYHASPVANWAALDEPDPVLEALGERAYEQLLDKLEGIVEDNEVILFRVRPDLSSAIE